MEGIINYIAVACSTLSLILDIVAVAIPNWIAKSPFHYGLWKYCVLDVCVDISDLFSSKNLQEPDHVKATRALLIIGLIILVAVIVMALLKMFVMKDNSSLSSGAAGSAIAGGLLILVGAIVFAAKEINDSYLTADTLSSGFALAIVSGVIAIIAGILFFIGKSR
ncbi:hypothetical protein ACJMK2_003991 [Sinanodonta woodiana]|uniref:Uncharacterized protein n=1 Tax=Sinanodonta woodiana TaxID=1069815 RepID=A0ABD3Y2K9_SINWO